MTTLGTTRADHSAAATGTLAHEEAVGTLAAHDGGLVSAFHDDNPEKSKTRNYIVLVTVCQVI